MTILEFASQNPFTFMVLVFITFQFILSFLKIIFNFCEDKQEENENIFRFSVKSHSEKDE